MPCEQKDRQSACASAVLALTGRASGLWLCVDLWSPIVWASPRYSNSLGRFAHMHADNVGLCAAHRLRPSRSLKQTASQAQRGASALFSRQIKREKRTRWGWRPTLGKGSDRAAATTACKAKKRKEPGPPADPGLDGANKTSKDKEMEKRWKKKVQRSDFYGAPL
nr:hypothetical protein [Pandoravirus belohorizontensis]